MILAGAFAAPAFLLSGQALAADCQALNNSIRKERSLMTRKTMIEDAMKQCPNDSEIVYQYGYTYERLRKYEKAMDNYKKAISLDPRFAKAYFERLGTAVTASPPRYDLPG